jgi:RNA polymerase sigma-70 factor (ECF subfamily)
LHSVAFVILRNTEDAEDAAQTTLINSHSHIKEFDGRSRFRTWITRITINASLMTRRKRDNGVVKNSISIDEPAESTEDDQFFINIPDPGHSPEKLAHDAEMRMIFQKVLQELPPKLRIAASLQLEKERSAKEIADELGMTLSGAKTRMIRARNKLKAMLEPYV